MCKPTHGLPLHVQPAFGCQSLFVRLYLNFINNMRVCLSQQAHHLHLLKCWDIWIASGKLLLPQILLRADQNDSEIIFASICDFLHPSAIRVAVIRKPVTDSHTDSRACNVDTNLEGSPSHVFVHISQ